MSLTVSQIDNFDGNYNFEGEFGTFYATGTSSIAVGDWVAFASANTGNPGGIEGMSVDLADSDTLGGKANTFGVATTAITAGTAGFVTVQIRGKSTTANVATGSTNGLALVISGTGGRADVASGQSTNDYRVIATCLSDASANVATVDILPHPRFVM